MNQNYFLFTKASEKQVLFNLIVIGSLFDPSFSQRKIVWHQLLVNIKIFFAEHTKYDSIDLCEKWMAWINMELELL